MDLQLSGQTAVVVGGARGIGLAIARAFAAEGAAVALVDRAPEVDAAARQVAENRRVRTTSFLGDVTSYEQMQRAAQSVSASLGRTDQVGRPAARGPDHEGVLPRSPRSVPGPV